jgi:hypothetical protein
MGTPRVDRRKRERRSCSLYLRLFDNRTGEPVGNLADISRDGFMLESLKPIPRNSEFSFRMDLPPDLSQKTYIVFNAQSVWSRTDPFDGRLQDTGFEITRMDPSDGRAFELIFDRYGSSRTGGNVGTGYSWKG